MQVLRENPNVRMRVYPNTSDLYQDFSESSPAFIVIYVDDTKLAEFGCRDIYDEDVCKSIAKNLNTLDIEKLTEIELDVELESADITLSRVHEIMKTGIKHTFTEKPSKLTSLPS